MVKQDLQTMKDKIRQLESGSGSDCTVRSDVSTVVGKRPSANFIPDLHGVTLVHYQKYIRLWPSQNWTRNMADQNSCQYVVQQWHEFADEARTVGQCQNRTQKKSSTSCAEEKSRLEMSPKGNHWRSLVFVLQNPQGGDRGVQNPNCPR